MNAKVDKNQVRRYLLGNLAEAEQAALETAYFADQELFEQVWATENELVDDYVRGRLSELERTSFERNYLASPKHQQRVAVARQLLQTADATIIEERSIVNDSTDSPWWANLIAFFQMPQLAVGGALALLLLTLGGWWFWRAQQPIGKDQVAQASPTPTLPPTPSVTPVTVTPTPVNTPSVTPSPSPQPSASTRSESPAILAFTLLRPVVRDSDKIQKLNIPAGTKQVQLRLKLPDETYPQYKIQLRSVGGQETLTQAQIKPPANGKALTVNIPSNQLPANDYFLVLSGVSKDTEAEELITYFFRVIKK